jgi:rubredoxin
MRKLSTAICDCAVCSFYTAINSVGDEVDSVCEETGFEFVHVQNEIPEWCPLQKI